MQIRKLSFFGRAFILLLPLLATVLVALAAFYHWAHTPIPLANPEVEFVVPPGTGLNQAIASAQNAGVQVAEWPLKLLARYMGTAQKIKAGTYALNPTITPFRFIEKINKGEVVLVDVVLPEGWTFRQVRARLDAHVDLKHDTLGLTDLDVLRLIGASETLAEGLFFPDTYRVGKGASDLLVLKAAYRSMQAQLGQAWNTRTPGLPLATPYEALILASIIEKETGIEADRPLVASVFINRLRKRMLLQTDPTVIYGLGTRFDGNLRKRDLLADTPYNTYTRPGLPPSPIAMPGKSSIQAALRPPENNLLYFVGRGDGSSVFSANLEAHNRAVNRYQRGMP